VVILIRWHESFTTKDVLDPVYCNMRLEAHFYIWSQDVKDLSDLIQKVEEWENIWIQVQKAKPSPLDTAVLNAIEKASYNRE
jgi:hypothetical protein